MRRVKERAENDAGGSLPGEACSNQNSYIYIPSRMFIRCLKDSRPPSMLRSTFPRDSRPPACALYAELHQLSVCARRFRRTYCSPHLPHASVPAWCPTLPPPMQYSTLAFLYLSLILLPHPRQTDISRTSHHHYCLSVPLASLSLSFCLRIHSMRIL